MLVGVMAGWHDYVQPPNVGAPAVVGTLKVLDRLWSPQLANERQLLVYLPPSYGAPGRRYPVLYMHDGQNLFDPATSYAGEWHVDEAMEAASREGVEAIVVGIPNMGPARRDEYSPFRDLRHGGGKGDQYLQFIWETLKPVIDRDFLTLPGREHTGIIGSSMGGLISLYAFFRYPDIFGAAGVMSPSLWFAGGAIFRYLEEAPFIAGRIYLDVGTAEGMAELNDVRRLRTLLRRKGYHLNRDLLCRVDKGATHSEAAWARRLDQELRFLIQGELPVRRAPIRREYLAPPVV